MVVEDHPSVAFFNDQFHHQIAAGEFSLNPFEQAALPFVHGRVLDLGCGLGNLGLDAARRGCEVTAVDASAAAVERLAQVGRAENLHLTVLRADLDGYRVCGEFDTVIAIGLVMFFRCDEARRLLGEIRRGIAPRGHAIVNALIEGTTWFEAFGSGGFCLLRAGEIEGVFSGWRIRFAQRDEFPAPGAARKRFETVIAQRP